MYNKHIQFEFDPRKEEENQRKHGISFEIAKQVFEDPDVIEARDEGHSITEERWFAVGKIRNGRVITVWFTRRDGRRRIIGAAELRKGRKEYEKRTIPGFFKNEVG